MQMPPSRFLSSVALRQSQTGKIGLLCLVFLLTSIGCCSGADQKPASAAIDALVEEQIHTYNIPGLAIAVTRKNQIVFSRSYGLADLENQVRVTPATLFRIGSITKPITATAAMLLAERGQLDLDAPVQRYCPAFPGKPWPVTTRELLAHLGGVRGFRTENGVSPELLSTAHYDRVSDTIALFANESLAFKPSTQYEYSNYGYDLVGCALEGASGKQFEDLLRSTVFLIAGMTTSRIDDITQIIPSRSRSYSHAKDGTTRNAKSVDLSNRIPAAGILSTADDMARFVLALESGKVVSSKALQSMWTEQVTDDGKSTGYGLGWMIRNHHGTPAVAHTGEQPGSSTLLYVIPGSQISFVVLANTDAAGLWKLADLLADLLD
jgi:serine beta-lactamase-like protein LACTB, mitochondrial